MNCSLVKQVLGMVIASLCVASFAKADGDVEARLAALENKVTAMEAAIADKLKGCTMTYQFHGYRLNQCTEGTFARGANVLSETGNVQLECGYYQLKCTKQ